MRSHRLHRLGFKTLGYWFIGIWLMLGFYALVLPSYELDETASGLRVIQPLPANYNPYQKLYDEMLYPTVRIESKGGVGSGVFIHHKGTENTKNIYILTASHVVGNNTSVTVTIYSESVITSIPASVVITDTGKDLALLRVLSSSVVSTAKLAPCNYKYYLFTPVYTIGCSLGLDPRPSSGIISAIHISGLSVSAVEVTSPILPGNSGGPVYDANTHEVIGIAVWVKVYHGQLVTTMAGIVPIQVVYKFLESIKFIELPNSANSINSTNSINSKLKERR